MHQEEIERIGEKKVMLDTSNDEMLYNSKTARAYHGGNSPTKGSTSMFINAGIRPRCSTRSIGRNVRANAFFEPLSKGQAAVFAEEIRENVEEGRATELGLIDARAID